jgi:hypothetical protein
MIQRVRKRCITANALFAKARAWARRFNLIHDYSVVQHVAPL